MNDLQQQVEMRRTFAIISHPDAGKTTLTEKLLLFGGAISLAGTVKGRKASRHATSDWMALEKQRGISVTTSVMQFFYEKCVINLLDTPGHEDFSEDTYRTLTAVDTALMVIDAAKGVEPRTIKLMEVCCLRRTPIITFINKLDRESRDPIDLLDEIEAILKINCAPITWPIGTGKRFRGIYHLYEDAVYLYEPGKNYEVGEIDRIIGLDSQQAKNALGDLVEELQAEIELVLGASHQYNREAFLRGELTPVYFGSAVNNFGVRELLNGFVQQSTPPQPRATEQRIVKPLEEKFSGFVFKIQANMDPLHRDRVAFLRVSSGKFRQGMKMRHIRIDKDLTVNRALTFMAGSRENANEAFPGDIIGLYNHGTIRIGDSFSEGEKLKFTGIPNFSPELFQLVRLKNPLKQKALIKGLVQLSEEGATQVFRPLHSNELILGAVGVLQFDVVSHRLKHEYGVECVYEAVNIATARWVSCEDQKLLEEFKLEQQRNLALDNANQLAYLAPSRVSLEITSEQWPKIQLNSTREI